MNGVSITDTIPAQGETFSEVILRLWEDVEQTPDVPSLESLVITHLRAGGVSTERQPSKGVTPGRVRYTFD